jgi:hypothetical protein
MRTFTICILYQELSRRMRLAGKLIHEGTRSIEGPVAGQILLIIKWLIQKQSIKI